MKKALIILMFVFIVLNINAQERYNYSPNIHFNLNSYTSSGSYLPFWFTANQNGAFTMENKYYQILKASFTRDLSVSSDQKWDFTYGATMIAGYADKSAIQMNQYWLGTRFRWIDLKIGAKNDSIRFAGLSHTNGNMIWSGNARPLPGITFSTHGFIPIAGNNKWLTIKALYEENFLFDKRDMKNAMLHHKYLYGKATINSWSFTLGLDHWCYWGGTSMYNGKTPGIEDYFRYVLALKGGNTSSRSDQINASGNSIGMYVFEMTKSFNGHTLTIYWNHPFEDRSGLEMANYPDGIWGVNLRNKNRKAIISDVGYEFMNTLDQSGPNHLVPLRIPGQEGGRGRDNYFALGIGMGTGNYSSGHVHYNKMMGTPVFIPVIGENGVSRGFDNTRIRMHHLGLGGTIIDRLTWKSLFTWSRSFGTYEFKHPEPVDQFSWLAQFNYKITHLPITINVGFAGDSGERFERLVGVNAGASWLF